MKLSYLRSFSSVLKPLVAVIILTGCGATVTTRRVDPVVAWRTWRKDGQWVQRHQQIEAQLRETSLYQQWKTDPDAVLATLRTDSVKKPELHSAVAILASELALQREEQDKKADVRGLWLLAAEGAFYSVKSSSKDVLLADEGEPARFMANLYNRAVSHFVNASFNGGGLRGSKTEQVTAPGGTFAITVNPFRSGAIEPRQFDELIPSSTVKVEGIKASGKLPGVGATFIGVINRTPERVHDTAFAGRRGLSRPVTAVAVFPDQPGKKSRAEISLIDPVARREVPGGAHPIPVSADCVAPLALELNGIRAHNLGVGGLLRAENRMEIAGLYMLQPYDPNRIPVLMIHGLNSSPLIWRDLIAEMQADPVIGPRYQFWVFYYPSGIPIPFSRRLIVDKIEAVKQHFDPQGKNPASNNMVLIGHSMGGVLSRSLITNVGDRFWKQFSDRKFDDLKLTADIREKIRSLAFPKPVSQVKRAIFVCAPHRGAKMADGWLGQLGSSLVRMPVDVIKTSLTLFSENADLVKPALRGRKGATSINSLEPDAPIFAALNSSPFVKGVPYHSIIGDRGKGDTPKSSDGFVEYWSSHLDGATSELIVPGDHSGYTTPEAIAEIRRILRLHLGQSR